MDKSELFVGWKGSSRRVQVKAEPSKASLPWKTVSLKDADALSAEDVGDLAQRFGIELEKLEDLGLVLSSALDPEWTLHAIEVDEARDWKRAMRLFEDRIGAKDRATLDWIDLEEVVSRLYVNREVYPKLWRDLFLLRHEMLHSKDLSLEDKIRLVRDLLFRGKGKIVLPSPTDRRCVGDLRRSFVVDGIVGLWRSWGRDVTWKTDWDTYDRGGPLIEFIVAVIERLTEPRTVVPNETIVKDLRAIRAEFPPRS